MTKKITASQNVEDKDVADLTDDELIYIVSEFRSQGVEGSANLYDRMRKAEDFVIGGDLQWDPAVKEANEGKGKFCLTIPLVKPQIKQVIGTSIQNPKDFKVYNTKGGSATIAKVLTALAKQAMDSEQARFEKTHFCESGLNTGSGQLLFALDSTTDPMHKNVVVEHLNEHEVLWDPNCNVYDPNSRGVGAKFVIWEPWVDKDLIDLTYPDKKSELPGGTGGVVSTALGMVGGFISWLVGNPNKQTSIFGPENRTDVKNLEKTRYQLSHTWWVKPVKATWWYDKRKSEFDAIILVPGCKVQWLDDTTGETTETVVTKEMISKVNALAKEQPDTFIVKETIQNVMIHTIRVGETLLDNIVDELNLAQSGICLFPLIGFYPYFTNGYKSGMAEDMIGTQEEINYAHSMSLNLIKTIANTGLIIDGGPGTEKYMEFLKTNADTDGVILEKKRAGGNIEKIQPTNYPVAFETITDRAKENLKQITGVRTEDPTTAKDRVARTIQLKQQSAQTATSSMFMNYDYSVSLIGNLLLEIIRNNDIFSEDEIGEVVDKEDLIDAELLKQAGELVLREMTEQGHQLPTPPQQPQEQTPEAIQAFQQSVTLFEQFRKTLEKASKERAVKLLMTQLKEQRRRGRYNTKVELSPAAPTYRLARSAELFELNDVLVRNRQTPIDRELLIKSTDVDNKQEIIDKGREAMANQPQPAMTGKAGA
jgi:hypothetical protein